MSNDGSLSAFNTEFGECYSSLSEGALGEKMTKHIIPALFFLDSKWQSRLKSSLEFSLDFNDFSKDRQPESSDIYGKQVELEDIWILDICFGLGYNAFLSALAFECRLQRYFATNRNINPKKQPPKLPKIHIISLEKDKTTLDLSREIFCLESSVWKNLSHSKIAQITPSVDMQILWGDACEMLEKLDFGEIDLKDCKNIDLKEYDFGGFDIMFQDPFSASKNPTLWSLKHFKRLFNLTKNECIITSYATKQELLERAKKAGFISCKIKPSKMDMKILDFVLLQDGFQTHLQQDFKKHLQKSLQNGLKNQFDFEALFQRVKKRRQSSIFSKSNIDLAKFMQNDCDL